MSFDIKKYCHITGVVNHKGKEVLKCSDEGLNIFLAAKGSFTAQGGNIVLTAKKDEIICCDGKVEIHPDDNCEIQGFTIVGIIREKFSKEIDTAFITSGIFAPFLPQQITQIVRNFDSLSETYISNISFEIINTLSHGEKTAVIASQVIIDAVRLIKENYANVYGVEELARTLKISKSHLVREFYKHTGTTPGKYLTSVRIDAVKQLLTQTSLPLSVIALQTGFSGDNYLCKAFKKVTGETPMAYKQRVISSQYLPNQLTLQVNPDVYTG